MNGKRARELRQQAHQLSTSTPHASVITLYRNLKRAYTRQEPLRLDHVRSHAPTPWKWGNWWGKVNQALERSAERRASSDNSDSSDSGEVKSSKVN